MNIVRKGAAGLILFGIALSPAVYAKSPAAADEAQIRSVIERIYASYTRPLPEAPAEGSYAPENGPGATLDDYDPPYTVTLDELVKRWGKLMRQTEELYGMNSFDWFCQCQDNDNKTAKLVRQTYRLVGKDRIDVNVLFSPGWSEQGQTGAPLIYRFRREAGSWKVDDMKFHKSGTLRRSLVQDIKDAEKDLAAK